MTQGPNPKKDEWILRLEDCSATGMSMFSKAKTLEELEAARVEFLGRKGKFTQFLKELKDFSLTTRRPRGAGANKEKKNLEAKLEERRRELESERIRTQLAQTQIDLRLPASVVSRGHRHPLTQTIAEMAGILSQLGFSWADGPLVETDYYNFEALNIPPDHPARDLQDTFYLDDPGKRLLRTHTSPVQIRYMKENRPPLRIMAPGRVFRHEAVDASHSSVFHQVEGLYVDRAVTMADLKGTLQIFLNRLFGRETKTRFLPSYYPFTEPSADVYAECLLCSGRGCAACKQSGWMEVLGCGLVHPEVLRGVGLDPESFSGFAFGIGVERIAMLKLDVPDIRMFYENDLRFLEQF